MTNANGRELSLPYALLLWVLSMLLLWGCSLTLLGWLIS